MRGGQQIDRVLDVDRQPARDRPRAELEEAARIRRREHLGTAPLDVSELPGEESRRRSRPKESVLWRGDGPAGEMLLASESEFLWETMAGVFVGAREPRWQAKTGRQCAAEPPFVQPFSFRESGASQTSWPMRRRFPVAEQSLGICPSVALYSFIFC